MIIILLCKKRSAKMFTQKLGNNASKGDDAGVEISAKTQEERSVKI